MSPEAYDTAHWLMAAVDPVLVLVALVLGWKASQFGKVFIAAIAALGLSVLASWAIHALEVSDGRITRMTAFLDTRLFDLFGLPRHPTPPPR